MPERQVHNVANFSYGNLLFITLDPCPEAHDIFVRFSKVFDQTYTRFLDLQKAETQAREAHIEAALERVRSRTMAMQRSNELGAVATVLFEEMNRLVANLWTCGFVLCEKERSEDEWWLSMDTGFTRGFFLPNVGDLAHATLYEGWMKQEDFRAVQLDGDLLQEHYRWLMTMEVSRKIFEEMDAAGLERPTWQKLHAAYFSKGYLVLITREPCGEEEVFKRFAQVFDLTYTRFLDLQLAEAQAEQAQRNMIQIREEKLKAEIALTELKAAQTQLIQAEKMASLGELTAGIAHEIQNPLNFVNNFSEVSSELVDEMNEELDKGDLTEARAIASDIKQNLERIGHHGKRADSIVKGMLEHSRSSSGEKQPTDINKLADEFLRLAYHGVRAKDKGFNVTLKTEFDESIGLVNTVSQDIGRVLLNLINNAFYAVDEKRSSQRDELYEPTVSVSTKKVDHMVEIVVADNGNGIPEKIMDKIFQPFFTTKPTGQGTGLGLSLCYDIVKANGGEIRVSTTEWEGARFVMSIPDGSTL
jgi:signal transduction histidine kinase